MTWLIASLLLYGAIAFVKNTIEKGKARSLRQSEARAAKKQKLPKPDPTSRSPHAVLGVAKNATREEIQRAYRKLAAEYHPDKVDTSATEIRELAAKRLREINAAYAEIGKK